VASGAGLGFADRTPLLHPANQAGTVFDEGEHFRTTWSYPSRGCCSATNNVLDNADITTPTQSTVGLRFFVIVAPTGDANRKEFADVYSRDA